MFDTEASLGRLAILIFLGFVALISAMGVVVCSVLAWDERRIPKPILIVSRRSAQRFIQFSFVANGAALVTLMPFLGSLIARSDIVTNAPLLELLKSTLKNGIPYLWFGLIASVFAVALDWISSSFRDLDGKRVRSPVSAVIATFHIVACEIFVFWSSLAAALGFIFGTLGVFQALQTWSSI